MPKKKNKTKETRVVQMGRVYVTATFNNTLITVTDGEGKVLFTMSSGMFGFKGTRKATPYAATITIENALKRAIDEYKLKTADVYLKGIGPGRDAALRVLKSLDLDINQLVDITPIPHNGVRPPKVRRT
ncbi:MAG: 30S ribosomal protein S11 [Patescibacteria group bacterium]|nr:MAG: 30S ribosomal protein S11 [Patescibacteria group bacterium]